MCMFRPGTHFKLEKKHSVRIKRNCYQETMLKRHLGFTTRAASAIKKAVTDLRWENKLHILLSFLKLLLYILDPSHTILMSFHR